MDYWGSPELKGAKPTFVMAAITCLEDELLRPGWRAFEWGSGGSTLWLSQWCVDAVSVEHDSEWYDQTRAELKKYAIHNVKLALVHDMVVYPDYIYLFPVHIFDLVFVDGRRRADCIVNASACLRPGGVLVLDDSEREQYQEAIRFLASWPRRDFASQAGPQKMTTIWTKPENGSD